ncbi:hypothetical protein AKJ16_DCAP23515 [Drosera capensis]
MTFVASEALGLPRHTVQLVRRTSVTTNMCANGLYIPSDRAWLWIISRILYVILGIKINFQVTKSPSISN